MKRRHISEKAKFNEVWPKTGGFCHVCGARLSKFAGRGQRGRWHMGHIKHHSRGGSIAPVNLLPTCRTCNRYVWDHTAQEVRKILIVGTMAIGLMKGKGDLAKDLRERYRTFRKNVRKRRIA